MKCPLENVHENVERPDVLLGSTYKIKTALPKKLLKYLPSSAKLAKEVGILKEKSPNE